VDNLMNVVGENEDEYGSLRDTTRLLHWLCRHAGCAVIVLHHMREEDSSAREFLPARKGRLQGKVSNFPEVILSISLDENGQNMLVAAVKNRFGRQDKSGKTYEVIPCDLDRAQFFNSQFDKTEGRAA
jgi:RecA-family ATPase